MYHLLAQPWISRLDLLSTISSYGQLVIHVIPLFHSKKVNNHLYKWELC